MTMKTKKRQHNFYKEKLRMKLRNNFEPEFKKLFDEMGIKWKNPKLKNGKLVYEIEDKNLSNQNKKTKRGEKCQEKNLYQNS